MAELAASKTSASGGRRSEFEKAQKQGVLRANANKTTMLQAVSRGAAAQKEKQNMQMWRNWQTRWIQVPVKAISYGFKSLHLHQNSRRGLVPLLEFLCQINPLNLLVLKNIFQIMSIDKMFKFFLKIAFLYCVLRIFMLQCSKANKYLSII